MTAPARLANVLLFALTLFYIIMLGGGNYEQMNVTTIIVSAPPKSMAMLQGPYGFTPFRFWATFRPITVLLFLLTLIFNWNKSIHRRKLLLFAFIIDLIVTAATFLYFAPETGVISSAAFDSTSVDASLLQRAQLWKNLNWIRLIVFYIGATLLLLAVNTPIVGRSTNYPNNNPLLSSEGKS